MADRAPTASALPPAVARPPLVIRFDLLEASENITDWFHELNDDGSNAEEVECRALREIHWIFDLLKELAGSIKR